MDYGNLKEPSYRIQQLAGRCANGLEGGRGRLWHAVPRGTIKALCGQEPGRLSGGWSEYDPEEKQVTCPRCLRKLKRVES